MRKYILIAFFGIISAHANAQDIQFSQYYQAPLFLNPGFTGITPQQRVVINHRTQWPNLPQAYSTYAASYDIFVEELRSGFGMLLTTDKMGSAGWQTSTFNVLYSFKVRLTEKLVFSPGLVFGYGTHGIDQTKLRLGDGLEFERDGQYYTLDPEQGRLGKQNYFDVGTGFLFYSRSLWLGAAFHHLNKPNLSLLGDVSRLPIKTTVHGGARLNLSGSGPRGSAVRMSYLTPSFIIRTQGPSFSQMDIGVNYHIDPVSIGVWYRGKPILFETFEQTDANDNIIASGIQQDALILSMGLYFKNFTIGYSYDFTISELQTATGGAHEISFVYEFTSKPASRSVKKKYRLIPCPTFNSKEGFWN
jgi:type IX secretion system PorP/SprF family membrane protein